MSVLRISATQSSASSIVAHAPPTSTTFAPAGTGISTAPATTEKATASPHIDFTCIVSPSG